MKNYAGKHIFIRYLPIVAVFHFYKKQILVMNSHTKLCRQDICNVSYKSAKIYVDQYHSYNEA